MTSRRQIPPLQMDAAPHSIEAEQALLGAILINNEVLSLLGSLKPEHFFDALHQRIFRACLDMAAAGRIATMVTIAQQFRAEKIADDINGAQYIARLAAEATTIVNAPDYAASIIDTATRRALIGYAHQLEQTARTPDAAANAEQMIDEAEAALGGLRSAAGADQVVSHAVVDVADRLIAQAERAAAGDAAPIPSSGFADIDHALARGLRPSRLIVLAGRPGMGKTQLATAIGRRVARQGWGVAFFSLEIDEDEMTSRLIAAELAHAAPAGGRTLDYRDILAGTLDAQQIDTLRRGRERVKDLPFEIVPEGGLTLSQIDTRSKLLMARWEKRGIRAGAIIVDYLQKMRASDRYQGNRVQEVSEMIAGAKDMAKRLKTCVVMLSQLSRESERRDDKHPLLSDLRDTGAIEQEADAVGLMYRPAYYDRLDGKAAADPEKAAAIAARANNLEVDFAKNRLGPPMTVTLYCDIGCGLIDNKRGW